MEDTKSLLKAKFGSLVEVNSELSLKMEEVNEIKERKREIEDELSSLLKEHDLENKTFLFNDKKIQQKKSIQYQALSMKYIENCLDGLLDDDMLEKVVERIKGNRSFKEKNEIRIVG